MTTNRTDLDLQLDQARRCDWYYFTLTALDRIKTNFMPHPEEKFSFYAVPGGNCCFAVAFRSRFPARKVKIDISGELECRSTPVFNVVYPEESALLPDRLGEDDSIAVLPANTAGSFLINISVPEELPSGKYTISLQLQSSTHRCMTQEAVVEVLQALPQPEFARHIIFWPHWRVFAEHFGLKLWSDEFFEKAEPYLLAMRHLGMNGIMASIVHDPFHYPLPEEFYAYNDYPAMIRWQKDDDGNWHFDYSVYDRYVKWNMAHGIDAEIECHSLLPCKNQQPELAWFDSRNQFHTCRTTFDAPDYRNAWRVFLTDFMAHNRAMGWEKLITICPYDEPANPESFISAAKLIREYAPEARITAAIGSEKAVAVAGFIDIATLHLDSGYSVENEDILRQQGIELRWYNCCFPDWGNTLFNCSLAECYRMPFISAAGKYSGFLRWSVFDWPETVLSDPAFNWPTGDAFLLYPGETPVFSLRAVAWLCGQYDLKLLLAKKLNASETLSREIEHFISTLGRKEKLTADETIGKWQNEICALLKKD